MMAKTLEDLVECAICMETLEKPKILSCAHSFCLSCLESLPIIAGHLRCPTCRKKTAVDKKGVQRLTDDFRLVQLKEILEQQKQTNPFPPDPDTLCDVCSKFPHAIYCMQSQKKICRRCLKVHNVFEIAVSHTHLKVEDVVSCPEHSADCNYACGTCKRLVCCNCVVGKCQDHSCCEIRDLAEDCLKEGDTNLIRRIETRTRDEIEKQIDICKGLKKEVEDHYENVKSALFDQRRQLLHDITVLENTNISAIQSLEEKDMMLARRVMEACYSGPRAADGGGQADLQEGIPSVFLKLMPTLQAMASSTEPLAPSPSLVPGLEFSLGKLAPQKPPKTVDQDSTVSLTGETEPEPGPSVNPEDSIVASVPHNPEYPPENRDDIAFAKVVHDTRRMELGIVARYKNYIVRLECLGGGKICVQIYERDVHCGYYDELEFIEHSKITLETGDTIYGEYVEYLRCKLFNYLQSRKGECVLGKVVHDHRYKRNHLMAMKGELIITYGLDTRQYEVITTENELYPDMEGMLQRFYSLHNSEYNEQVKAMKKQLQLYKVAHELLKSPSTSNAFMERQVPVAIYTKEDEIFGSEWKEVWCHGQLSIYGYCIFTNRSVCW